MSELELFNRLSDLLHKARVNGDSVADDIQTLILDRWGKR